MKGAEEVPEGLRPSDWASVRAAYEAHRHAVVVVEGEHRARNPGQQWLTKFDGRGFLVRPDQGTWSWGLQLESCGFAEQARPAGDSPKIKTDGQRLSYAWDGRLKNGSSMISADSSMVLPWRSGRPVPAQTRSTLPPDHYTALLSGVNNGTGNGVVEVFELGAP